MNLFYETPDGIQDQKDFEHDWNELLNQFQKMIELGEKNKYDFPHPEEGSNFGWVLMVLFFAFLGPNPKEFFDKLKEMDSEWQSTAE